MSIASLGSAAARIWPAVAGVCGAVYFASIGQYDQAAAVLAGGLGLAQALRAPKPPPDLPPLAPA